MEQDRPMEFKTPLKFSMSVNRSNYRKSKSVVRQRATPMKSYKSQEEDVQ